MGVPRYRPCDIQSLAGLPEFATESFGRRLAEDGPKGGLLRVNLPHGVMDQVSGF